MRSGSTPLHNCSSTCRHQVTRDRYDAYSTRASCTRICHIHYYKRYMLTCSRTSLRTCRLTDRHVEMRAYRHSMHRYTCMTALLRTNMQTYGHTDIRTCIRTYRHTDMHTDMQTYRHTDAGTAEAQDVRTRTQWCEARRHPVLAVAHRQRPPRHGPVKPLCMCRRTRDGTNSRVLHARVCRRLGHRPAETDGQRKGKCSSGESALRYCSILSENSACQVPICAVAA